MTRDPVAQFPMKAYSRPSAAERPVAQRQHDTGSRTTTCRFDTAIETLMHVSLTIANATGPRFVLNTH
jgi:hypothetical protein